MLPWESHDEGAMIIITDSETADVYSARTMYLLH